MKTRIIKWYNMLLGALLGALGFSSCNVILDPFMACEYGQPMADYKLVGKVTDEAGNPLKGIRVVFHPNAKSAEEDNAWNSDTLYSDASGKFEKERLKYDWPDDLKQAYVKFDDVDGDANGGSFKSAVLPREALKVDQTKKGDGKWYNGAMTVTADARLEKEN